MKRFKKLIPWMLALFLALLAGFFYLVKAPVDPPPQAPSVFAARPKPPPRLPPLDIRVLETGYSQVPEALVVRGGQWGRKKIYRHDAFLIRHPRGTLIFDGGLGTTIDADFATAPWYQRMKPFVKGPALRDALAATNLPERIDFFLLSHGHWDHLSGMLDFPKVPIRLLPEEIAFLNNPKSHYHRGVFPGQLAQVESRLEPLVLQDKPYENFSRSLDLFGDGSLVAVALPGHTPGSLGLFVNLPDSQRFLLVGDAVHGIQPDGSPEERTRLMEFVSDNDRIQAQIMRGKLKELIAHSNEVKLVPTHQPDLLENYLKSRPATPKPRGP